MRAKIASFEHEPFEYPDIPVSAIRLLSFVNRLDDSPPPSVCGVPLLEFVLEQVDINSKPKYDALSYTWGNPKPTSPNEEDDHAFIHRWPIAVNDRLLYVTKNLYEALCQLRNEGSCASDDGIDRRNHKYNKTRLIEAAEEGRLSDVKNLIKLGAGLRCVDEFGETALHYAAENGHLEIVRTLLQNGADPTVLDGDRRTPLDCCMQSQGDQYDEIAELLRTWEVLPGSIITKPPTKGSTFWIDAVCINQSSIAERNAQMALMGQIYRGARSVIVWLGAEDDTVGLARQALTKIHVSEMDIKKTLAPSFLRHYYCFQDSYINQDATPDGILLSIRQVQSILELFRRSWFRRMWVIQEMALAEKIQIQCGTYTFYWTEFLQIWQPGLGEKYFAQGGTPVDPVMWPAIKYGRGVGTEVWSLTGIRLRTRPDSMFARRFRASSLEIDWDENWRTQLSLPALIVLSWNFAVSDPRDKIFALLSIAQPAPDEPPITPDYSKTVPEVFTEAGRIFIQARGNNKVQDQNTGKTDDLEPIEALSFVQAPIWCTLSEESCPCDKTMDGTRRPYGLPSWVPTFHWQLNTARLFDSRFHASGDRPFVIHPSEFEILKTDGFMFDSVVEIQEKNYPELPVNHPWTVDILGWFGITTHLDPVYPTGIDRTEALWRTMCADSCGPSGKSSFKEFIISIMDLSEEWEGEEPDPRRKDLLEELLPQDSSNSLPSLEECENSEIDIDRIEAAAVVEPFGDDADQGDSHFFAEFYKYQRNRRLIRTKKGYLGLAPRDTQVRDQIWLLAGGRTPFVVRPMVNSHQFMFVGEVYVHGIMHGEALDADTIFETIEIA